jgi:tetratricopeptide (TPR) repeat protein
MPQRDTMSVDDAITNELRFVNFLLQGGNRAKAALRALHAAMLYAGAGRRKEALTVVEWALEVEPSVFTGAELTLCLYTVGDGVLRPFRTAAMHHLEAGRDDEARALLEILVKHASDDALCRLLLADLRLRQGDHDRAIADLWAAADLFEKHGRAEGRTEVMHRILGIDPNDAAALREVARAELLALDIETALGVLTRLLQLRPTDRVARELLAETLARSQRAGSAMAILRSLVSRYERHRQYGRLLELLDRALTWNPADERFCVALDGLVASAQKALPAAPAAESKAVLRVVGS